MEKEAGRPFPSGRWMFSDGPERLSAVF